MGWSINITNHAYAVRADTHPERAFIKNFMLNLSGWMANSIDYFTSAHINKGPFYVNMSYCGMTKHWMFNWQAMAAYQTARLCDFLPLDGNGKSGAKRAAELGAKYIIKLIMNAPYATSAYSTIWNIDGAGFMTLLPDDEWPASFSCTFQRAVGTATPPFGLSWQNGDKLQVIGVHSGAGNQTAPSGINLGIYIISSG